jgi:hypothetical protein
VVSKTHRDRYGSPWHTDIGATADGDPAPSSAVR